MNPDSPQNTGPSLPSIDPYAVQAPAVYAEGDVSIRPTGLTVIAVISLLAGIVGMLSGLLGLVGMFVRRGDRERDCSAKVALEWTCNSKCKRR